MTMQDASRDDGSSYKEQLEAALLKLDTIRKLVTGLPPTGDPVLVARWLVDDLREAAK